MDLAGGVSKVDFAGPGSTAAPPRLLRLLSSLKHPSTFPQHATKEHASLSPSWTPHPFATHALSESEGKGAACIKRKGTSRGKSIVASCDRAHPCASGGGQSCPRSPSPAERSG